MKVEAVVGTTTLGGTLPAPLTRGEIGLIAKRGAGVDLAGFSLNEEVGLPAAPLQGCGPRIYCFQL